MEYEGIVAGIGDLENQVNLVSPEMDAALYRYVMNKNTIISGLEVNNGVLYPGMCILCGYRGVLETAITLDDKQYVYAKFVLNFNNSIIDTFSIETSYDYYTPPRSITTAGTYRLLLYTHQPDSPSWNANDDLDLSNKFPNYAKHSEQTELVKYGGILRDGVTGFTQNVNDNSNKIATTQYVHNQIAEEINYDTQSGSGTHATTCSYTYTVKRKSKYVLVQINFTGNIYFTQSDSSSLTIPGIIPSGFRPKATTDAGVEFEWQAAQSSSVEICSISGIEINTSGAIHFIPVMETLVPGYEIRPRYILIGYDIN